MPGVATNSSNGLDMKAVEQLTNPSDITKLLHESLATERTIDAGLDQLLSRRVQLKDELIELAKFSEEVLEVVQVDAEQMLENVERTAAVAEQISARVKELDSAQSNVKKVVTYIQTIMDRTSCVERLEQAMSAQDYEEAALCIGRFRELQARLLQEGDSQQQKVVGDFELQLEEIVRAKFGSAVDDQEHAEVTRFVKLFKPLNKKDEGLRRYLDYMKGRINSQGRGAYRELANVLEGTHPEKADFVGALTQVCKGIALTVEENEEILKNTFGTDALLEGITALQHECDTHGSRILLRYLEARGIPRIVKELGLRKKTDITLISGPASSVDPRQIEDFLKELLLLCQRCEEYSQFMLGKMAATLAPNQLSPIRETSFRGGQLNVSARELLGHYISLEEFYMEENVKKAVDIDVQVPKSLTSSMVDDIFFILRKCASRALSTTNLQCVCSIMGLMNSLLGSNVVTLLQKRLAPGPTKLIAELSTETSNHVEDSFAIYLNNSEVSSGYILKLKAELDQYVGRAFPSSKDREIAKSALADLHRTCGDFQRITTRAIDQLCSGLMSKLKGPLEDAGSSTYELSDIEYSSNELRDTWVHSLLKEVDRVTVWLSPILVPKNLESALQLLIDSLASRIEAIMLQKKFNQLGGLQLDRDVRTLMGHLSEISQGTVREKFSRLTQIATIVCLENVDELLEFWGDGNGLTWKLTPGEVKSVLRLRVDFQDSRISALILQP